MNFNEQMNTLYKNISLTLYSWKGWCFCGVWEMGGETYTQREDFFFPYLLPRARGCQFVRDASDRLRVPCSTAILCSLPKSDRVILIMWSPSGYTPVRPKWPDVLSSSCLLIKMWQLAKAHGVTRNKPKINVICYITHRLLLCRGVRSAPTSVQDMTLNNLMMRFL